MNAEVGAASEQWLLWADDLGTLWSCCFHRDHGPNVRHAGPTGNYLLRYLTTASANTVVVDVYTEQSELPTGHRHQVITELNTLAAAAAASGIGVPLRAIVTRRRAVLRGRRVHDPLAGQRVEHRVTADRLLRAGPPGRVKAHTSPHLIDVPGH